ncbi:LysR family transcriptional regulator [Maridesulfovibrio zosterae]|uniref:LysR family transcriptional regulator n=1 Tax=Maridesulfovibrio zosterae TaxID=82171 RepID=UPI00041E414E|nr:LysR family transcriptional regulator [Maridesulfovibrio zosterae]
MELYQLVSFAVVAEEGNMTRAAARLNLTQPAISVQLKSLEEKLGFSLFQRTPKGMKLTEEGQKLKIKADIVLSGMKDFNTEAEKLRGGAYGEIILGVNTDPLLLRLEKLYTRLKEQHPDILLTVQESMSWDAVEKLNTGKIDLGFSYSIPHDNKIEVQLLGEIDLAIVGPEKWRSRLEGKTEKDLATFPWIWTSEHCPINMILTNFFESIGKEPLKAIVVDQEAAILKLVSDGVGLSVMPVSKIENVKQQYKIFPITKLNKKLKLYIICLKRRKMDNKISILLNLINEVWEKEN